MALTVPEQCQDNLSKEQWLSEALRSSQTRCSTRVNCLRYLSAIATQVAISHEKTESSRLMARKMFEQTSSKPFPASPPPDEDQGEKTNQDSHQHSVQLRVQAWTSLDRGKLTQDCQRRCQKACIDQRTRKGLLFLPDLQLFHNNKRRVDIKRRMDMDIIKLTRKNTALLQNSVNIMLLIQMERAKMRG